MSKNIKRVMLAFVLMMMMWLFGYNKVNATSTNTETFTYRKFTKSSVWGVWPSGTEKYGPEGSGYENVIFATDPKGYFALENWYCLCNHQGTALKYASAYDPTIYIPQTSHTDSGRGTLDDGSAIIFAYASDESGTEYTTAQYAWWKYSGTGTGSKNWLYKMAVEYDDYVSDVLGSLTTVWYESDYSGTCIRARTASEAVTKGDGFSYSYIYSGENANSCIVGPFNMVYESYSSSNFYADIAEITDTNGNSTGDYVTLTIGSTSYSVGDGWYFCGSDGKNQTTTIPSSGSTFYIIMDYNSDATTVKLNVGYEYDTAAGAAYVCTTYQEIEQGTLSPTQGLIYVMYGYLWRQKSTLSLSFSVKPTTLSFSGKVWEDSAMDGVYDGTESGVKIKSVTLYKCIADDDEILYTFSSSKITGTVSSGSWKKSGLIVLLTNTEQETKVERKHNSSRIPTIEFKLSSRVGCLV